MNFPVLVLVCSFITLWLATHVGAFIRTNLLPLKEDQRADFNVLQGAVLTMLGLLVGFTFSMAVSRYDQRKNYEEAEANAIGTEYVRADLLPADEATKLKGLLSSYLNQRVLFYTSRNEQQLRQIDVDTAHLQHELWSMIPPRALAQPTPIIALVAAGMNDVLNAQGYTQAAWWNRIPPPAWGLLVATAFGCNLLVGYGANRASTRLFWILPLAAAISLFLIADIDSPRGGLVRVEPQNLQSLHQIVHVD
jgi:hypothetical protein